MSEAELRAIADSLVPVDEASLRSLERGTPGGDMATDPPGGTATIQSLDEVAAAHPDVLVVAVTDRDTAEHVQALDDEADIGVPLLADPAGGVARSRDIDALPAVEVVGDDGVRLGGATGPVETAAEIESLIASLLGD